MRRPEDTLEKMVKDKTVAGLVARREEYPDIDVVLDVKAHSLMKRIYHGKRRPFYLRYGDEEEVRVTFSKETSHLKSTLPYFLEL
jgi:hypothetical protein